MEEAKETTISAPEAQATETKKSIIEFTGDIMIPVALREEITKKAEELKAQHKLRKIFVIVVEGEDGDEKPLYIAYLRRPSLMHFSQYMNFVQKDMVQASKMLATNTFLAGDRELVDDDDLFIFGTMTQLNRVIDTRNGEIVKR